MLVDSTSWVVNQGPSYLTGREISTLLCQSQESLGGNTVVCILVGGEPGGGPPPGPPSPSSKPSSSKRSRRSRTTCATDMCEGEEVATKLEINSQRAIYERFLQPTLPVVPNQLVYDLLNSIALHNVLQVLYGESKPVVSNSILVFGIR